MKRKRSNSNSNFHNIKLSTNLSSQALVSVNPDDFVSNQYRSVSPTKRESNFINNDNEADLDNNSLENQLDKKKIIKKETNVTVAIRKRPLSAREIEFNPFSTVRILDNKIVILLDPYEYNGHGEIFKNRNKEQHYTFDHAFDEDASQEDIYNLTISPLLDSVLDGYNCTIFAYGATGAGKTHTMFGTDNNPGIIPLCLYNLFNIVENMNQEDKIITIKMWYLEIYNENLRDLIKPSNDEQIDIREDPHKGSMVHGITEVTVRKSHEVLSILKKANKNRTTESTNANEISSRSHAVVQLFIEIKDKNSGVQVEIKQSKLSLIDLAGSERASATQNKGIRLIEGANINRSLLTLGNCITALSDCTDRGTKQLHVPYRDSKLTRILKDSLGGNSKTVMIANISPAVISFDDTYNTLKYANRAKNIKTHITKNTYNTQHHIANYENIINSLKQEIADLKQNKIYKSPIVKEDQNNLNTSDYFKKYLIEIKSHFEQEIKCKKESTQAKSEYFDIQKNTETERKNETISNENFDKEELEKKIESLEEKFDNLRAKRENLLRTFTDKNPKIEQKDNLNSIFEAHDSKLRLMEKTIENKYANENLGKKDFYIKQLENQIKLRDDIIQIKQIDLEESEKSRLKTVKELKMLCKFPKLNNIIHNQPISFDIAKSKQDNLGISQTPNILLNKRKVPTINNLPPIYNNIQATNVQNHQNNFKRNETRQPNKKNSSNSIVNISKGNNQNNSYFIKNKSKSHFKNNVNSAKGNKLNEIKSKNKQQNEIYQINLISETNNDNYFNNNVNLNEISNLSAIQANKLNFHQQQTNFKGVEENPIDDTLDLNFSVNNAINNQNDFNNKGIVKKKDMINHLYKRGPQGKSANRLNIN